MAQGFLGTPASIMLDVVICSLVLVVPSLIASIYLVRARHNYRLHRGLQIALCAVLLLVVLLFEIDMRLQGGFWAMAAGSAYAGTVFLKGLLYVHLFFAVSTVCLWSATLYDAVRRFGRRPRPSPANSSHKKIAWISVADMVGTVVTGMMVYYYGFMN